MEKAILYKEWIKTWRVFVLCLVAVATVAVYAVLRMNRVIELKGADHLWLIMLLKDQTFADPAKWTAVASGIALALAQMLPEMSQKRLKLTLHLPYPRTKGMLLMLGFGMAQLIAVCLLQSAIIGVYDVAILPWRLAERTLLTMLPWQLAGMVAYLITAAICIEGRLSRRLLLGAIGLVMVSVFFVQTAPEAYNTAVPAAVAAIIALFILPLGSVVRFKEGL